MYVLIGSTADRQQCAKFAILTDFAEVTEDFIEDDFNLTGLSQLVPFYKEALEMMLDVEPGETTLSNNQ